MLSDVNTKFYIVAGHLTVGKVKVVFRGRINFKRCIPKKDKVLEKNLHIV